LLVSLVSCGPALAQPGVDSTKVQVAVPKEVSARAAAPLNERALKLLAGHSEITLTLQVRNNPGRPPLKVDRVYLQTKNKP